MSDDCTDSTQLKKRQPPNLGNLLATATTTWEGGQEDYNQPEFDKIIIFYFLVLNPFKSFVFKWEV